MPTAASFNNRAMACNNFIPINIILLQYIHHSKLSFKFTVFSSTKILKFYFILRAFEIVMIKNFKVKIGIESKYEFLSYATGSFWCYQILLEENFKL